MTPRFDPSGLRDTRFWEYALRFAFGGVVTVATGLVAHAWGPEIGGLFLGFPAILPATLTLVKQHDGRAQAIEDARGGRLGSIGLVAFAAVVWATAHAWPAPVVLVAASIAWLAIDVALWTVRYGFAWKARAHR